MEDIGNLPDLSGLAEIAMIPNIEELQNDDLPTTPRVTKELYDIMYPELPTMEELVSSFVSFSGLIFTKEPQ